MAGYDLRYVGLDRLPSKLSEFDLDHYFSLSQADVAAVKERFGLTTPNPSKTKARSRRQRNKAA